MNRTSQILLGGAVGIAVLLPATVALPQYYGAPSPAPLYPYAVQPGQPYAIEVAPNTYVIQRPVRGRSEPYVASERRGNVITRVEPQTSRFDRPPKRNDPALVEELRRRHSKREIIHSKKIVNTKKIVHEPPVVIETKRYVDDPPRVIERRHYVDDDAPSAVPPKRRGKQVATIEPQPKPAGKRAQRADNSRRVIEADAEVTILGPDRMSIRLFRKGNRGTKANASAE